MKTQISDLLDGWDDVSVELVPPPEVSPERIRERTMKLLAAKSKPRRRVVPRLLACAAAAAVLSVSVVAAYQIWGPGDLFSTFFALKSTPLAQEQKELLNEIGTTDLAPSTSNGVTLTPLAAVTDEHTLYLRLRLEAPEGTILPHLAEQEGHIFMDVGLKEEKTGQLLNWGMQKACFLSDSTPEDNKTELVFMLLGSPDSANWNDGTAKTLTLTNLMLPSGSQNVVLEGTWRFDLAHSYQSKQVTVDTTGATYENAAGVYTLESLSLSPLSATFRISATDATTIPLDDVGIDVVLTDGSTTSLSCGVGTFGPDALEGNDSFDVPISLEEVEYIRFGPCTLTLP